MLVLMQKILIKRYYLKNCTPCTYCVRKINNKQINNAKYIDLVMPLYNLIKYSDNYSKTSGSLWQYRKDIPALNNNGDIDILDWSTNCVIIYTNVAN